MCPRSMFHLDKLRLPDQKALCCIPVPRYPYPWELRKVCHQSLWHFPEKFQKNASHNTLDPHRHKAQSHQPAFHSLHISKSDSYASRKYPEAGWILLPHPALSNIHPSWSPEDQSLHSDVSSHIHQSLPAFLLSEPYPISEKTALLFRPQFLCCHIRSEKGVPAARLHKISFLFLLSYASYTPCKCGLIRIIEKYPRVLSTIYDT